MASSPQKRSTAAAATKQVVAEEEKSPKRQSLDFSSPSVGGGGSVVIPERGAAMEEAEAEAEKLRRHSRRKSEDADRALRAATAASSSSTSTSSNRVGRAHNNNSSSAASISALSSAASSAASSHTSGSARCISPRRTSGPSRGGSAERISRRRRSEETERRRIRDRAALEESASRERKWFLGLLSAMANKRNNNNNAIDNKNNTATPSTTAKSAASSSSASSRSAAMNDNNKGDKNAAQKKRDEASSPVKVHKKSNDDNKKRKEDVVAVVAPSATTAVATTKEEDKAILVQANTKPQQQQPQPSAVSTDGGKLVTAANEPKKAPTTMSRSRLLYICVLEEATNTPTPFISSPVLAQPVAEASNDDLTEIVAGLTFRETETDDPLHQNPSLRRYARFHLKVALQFMGCKPLQASQITEWVFQLLKNPNFVKDFIQVKQPAEGFVKEHGPRSQEATGQQQQQASAPPVGWNADEIQLSETGASVTLTKPQFLRVIRAALNAAQYFNANPIEDFCISCDVINRKHSFIVLLGGTSGCGKSTLASLLASRIGFTTVISTDNIRHMLRSFMPQEQYPVLWASTYHAGEVMADLPPDISYKERILRGYKAQSQLVFKELDNIITGCERRHESLIVEGVHLNMDLVVQLMKRHPTCIPFLIYISNEAKHRSRFAIRSKYMTLDPRNNKYIKYFKNIRIISDFLCRRADRYLIPKIDNTSVDRSLSALHSTLFACIRRYAKGERMFDVEMNMCPIVHREYEAVKHAFWSSKVMYKVLKKKRISLECQKEEVMLANEAMKRAVIEAQDEEEEEEDEEAVRARSVDEYFADGGSIGS